MDRQGYEMDKTVSVVSNDLNISLQSLKYDEEISKIRMELAVPLAALKESTLDKLGEYLNPLKVLPTKSGRKRDWRGLAQLMALDQSSNSYLSNKENPTKEIIKLSIKGKFSNNLRTISDLVTLLEAIDRFDVIDDLHDAFKENCEAYKNTVSNSNREKVVTLAEEGGADSIITVEDSERVQNGERLPVYDAFVLYAEEDSEFACQSVKKLEGEYNLKLCVQERDLLPGTMFAHEAIGRLIEQRCNHLLVILSPSFGNSPANQFLLSYAQALGLETKRRKVIPCIYKNCEVPSNIKFLTPLCYERRSEFYNFWDRLGNALRAPSRHFDNPKAISCLKKEFKSSNSYSEASQRQRQATSEETIEALNKTLKNASCASEKILFSEIQEGMDAEMKPATDCDKSRVRQKRKFLSQPLLKKFVGNFRKKNKDNCHKPVMIQE